VVLLLLLGILLNPAAQADGFEDLRKAYDSQAYAQAIEALKSHPDGSPEYYFNLGTLYFRLNDFGSALAFLEKADRLAPAQGDIRHNLALARAAVESKYSAGRVDAASDALESATDALTPGQVYAFAGVLLLVAAWILGQAMRTARTARALAKEPLAWAAAGVMLLSAASLGAKALGDAHPAAVAVRSEVIRSGPADHYLNLGALEPGLHVRYLGRGARTQKEDWIQVRFGATEVGWIPRDSVLLL
jgi:tetratricopeptide (TPR) repeat protein